MKPQPKPAARTVDMTPTWRAVLPVLYTAAANGNANARTELDRLARMGDMLPAFVALAEAVDQALSSSGEFNNYTADHSLRDLKRMARAALRATKGRR